MYYSIEICWSIAEASLSTLGCCYPVDWFLYRVFIIKRQFTGEIAVSILVSAGE